MIERSSWEGRSRVDITASLPHPASETLRRRLVLAVGDDGATVRESLGLWQGGTERAYTVERIDPPDGWVSRIAGAAIAAGCEAIQVERFGEGSGGCGYCAEEWRRHAR